MTKRSRHDTEEYVNMLQRQRSKSHFVSEDVVFSSSLEGNNDADD